MADWRRAWRKRLDAKPNHLDFALPSGNMQPLGYIVRRRAIRLDRPVQALHKWISRFPEEYRRAVLQCDAPTTPTIDADEHLLANLQEYRALMPLAQEANKPMFMLKPADGALGAYMNAVVSCYQDYRSLAEKISDKLAASNMMPNPRYLQGSLFAQDLLDSSIAAFPEWAAYDDSDLAAFEREVQSLFDRFPTDGQPNETQTEDDLIWPVLRLLGWTESLRQQNLSAKGARRRAGRTAVCGRCGQGSGEPTR